MRLHLGPQVDALRPFPWQPKKGAMSKEGDDLGIPARVFPQWLRCTGCDFLGPLPRFSYTNTHPFRPDLASSHTRTAPAAADSEPGSTGRKRESPAVPAQHLLTCTNGHLDEFPYALWVHRGGKCPKAELPDLKMRDANVGKSVGSTIVCAVLRRDAAAWPKPRARSAATSCRRNAAAGTRTSTPSTPNATPARR